MIVLIQTDDSLMIFVLVDFKNFMYVELWQWCLSDLRYEYESMIWSVIWRSFMCFEMMIMKEWFELCFDVF
jgi:hypothetical protein